MAVMYFLHLLRAKWPSQIDFLAALNSSSRPERRRTGSERPRAILPAIDPDASSPTDETVRTIRTYLTSVATAIRRTNYFALAALLDPIHNAFLRSLLSGADDHDICTKALMMSVNQLREVIRDDIAWRCVHVAYREVSMREEVGKWLACRLLLVEGDNGKGIVDTWMEKRVEKGEVVKKEAGPGPGARGSWMMRRVVAQGPAVPPLRR